MSGNISKDFVCFGNISIKYHKSHVIPNTVINISNKVCRCGKRKIVHENGRH